MYKFIIQTSQSALANFPCSPSREGQSPGLRGGEFKNEVDGAGGRPSAGGGYASAWRDWVETALQIRTHYC